MTTPAMAAPSSAPLLEDEVGTKDEGAEDEDQEEEKATAVY